MLAEHGEEETFRFMREVVLKGKSFAEESRALSAELISGFTR